MILWSAILIALMQPLPVAEDSTTALCNSVEDVAGAVMDARQGGVSYEVMIEVLAEAMKPYPDTGDDTLLLSIIDEAFDMKQFTDPDLQAEATKIYKQYWRALCDETLKELKTSRGTV